MRYISSLLLDNTFNEAIAWLKPNGSKSIYLEDANLFMLYQCVRCVVFHTAVYVSANCAQSTQYLIIQHVACICQFRVADVLASNKYQFRTSQGSNL